MEFGPCYLHCTSFRMTNRNKQGLLLRTYMHLSFYLKKKVFFFPAHFLYIIQSQSLFSTSLHRVNVTCFGLGLICSYLLLVSAEALQGSGAAGSGVRTSQPTREGLLRLDLQRFRQPEGQNSFQKDERMHCALILRCGQV